MAASLGLVGLQPLLLRTLDGGLLGDGVLGLGDAAAFRVTVAFPFFRAEAGAGLLAVLRVAVAVAILLPSLGSVLAQRVDADVGVVVAHLRHLVIDDDGRGCFEVGGLEGLEVRAGARGRARCRRQPARWSATVSLVEDEWYERRSLSCDLRSGDPNVWAPVARGME